MSGGQTLRLEYLTPSGLRPEEWHGVLGAAAFDGAAPALRGSALDIPIAHVHTPVLGEPREVVEVWRTDNRTQSESHGRVRFARCGDLLFGSVAVRESDVADLCEPGARTSLEIATGIAYREMYATLSAASGPRLVRVWNYVPEINLDTHGLERYRQFNSARHEASVASGRAVTGSVPAASCLGAAAGSPLTVYFLASHRAPAFIENPRQVSAYRYPTEYGPRSPSFSRATVLGEGDQATLFISGTASIVGHRTMHAGDPAAQAREALANIEALVSEAARSSHTGALRLEGLAYKVYVRDPRELPLIRAELESALGREAALLYLKADICRSDLAVEIEAVGGHGWRPEE